MEVRFSKRFKKQYKKLPPSHQKRFADRLRLWQDNPAHPLLNHHELVGKLKGMHSINIGGDLRAIYRVVDETIFVYEMIGTHSQLYG